MRRRSVVGLRFIFCCSLLGLLSCSIHSSTQKKSSIEQPPAVRQEIREESDSIHEYQLGFGDVLDIKFLRNQQFNETITIRPDGRISLLKVGELLVTGLTASQLDSILTQLYGVFIREPDLTVIVRRFGGYNVYVLGEVQSPGSYPIQREMTILQALAAAGGPKTSASLGSVMVLRRHRIDVEAIRLDVVNMIRNPEGPGSQPISAQIEPQDVIFVPKTFIANVSDFMKQVYAGFLPPLDVYLRAMLLYDR